MLRNSLRLTKSCTRCIGVLRTKFPGKSLITPAHDASFQVKTFTCIPISLLFAKNRNFSSESNYEERHHDNSQDQTGDKSDEEIRREVLDNALKYVHEHGWTREVLAMSSEDLGYPSVTEGMFHRGGADLVLHFVKSNNADLVDYMENINMCERNKKTSSFIRNVLEHRLRMLIPVITVWPQAMAVLLQPSIIAEATQELGRMVDDIWFHAGDKSTDFNWYTKRGLLAKLFVSTQAVMVKDQSADFTDTWEFLDRRMKDIATFGKMSRSFQESGRLVSDIGVAGFTVLSNIIGVGERRR